MFKMEELLPILNSLHDDLLIETNEVPQNILYVLEECFGSLKSGERNSRNLARIQAVLDILWEDLNTGHWSEVPQIVRQLYSVASFLKVVELIKIAQTDETNCDLKEAIKAADLGLLLGSSCRRELSNAASLINKVIFKEKFRKDNHCLHQETSKNTNCFFEVPAERISEVDCPSLQYFSQHYFNPELPVKLTNCISHWPALKKWNDINYLKQIAEFRTVPIELGTTYAEEDWGMKLLTLGQFIEDHICTKSEKVGYLAQHQLFDQIPELKRDICEPEYCCLSKNEYSSNYETDINAWFGPKGTVTPLHYDPKHNLLSQVLGRKQVLLYSPVDTDSLYTHESKMLHNTSRVDPQNPNYKEFPRYKLAKGLMCILNPGDQLYIPPKWWHYVKSLDVSFSVSFWWE